MGDKPMVDCIDVVPVSSHAHGLIPWFAGRFHRERYRRLGSMIISYYYRFVI
jgi:hypothetical protein